MRRFLSAAVVLLCLVLSTHAFSQTSNATLGGTVFDASGALIPGVTITATNIATGIVITVISNQAGAYQFASLQTGTYRVSAELTGFQTRTYSDVVLGVSQQVRLNFTLQVSAVAQAVEVTVAADTLLATSSASVGAVFPEYKVRDLPLLTRNVIDLVGATAGTVGSNFAGGRPGQVNTTRDGIVVSDGRYLEANGAFSTTYTSPDLVEEVRIIVAPADAEAGRGSGQVQMATRSGTNQFRGALFWMNSNSALGANTWFNNFNGVGKDYQNRNQYGGRIGGPVLRNKTFFFFLYEGQRYVTKQIFTGSVLTADARKGIFRFFPGVQNGNAFSSNPTVDLQGNPVTPLGATGSLSSFSVFGRDPARPGFDPSGWIERLIERMPPPNDFTTCGPNFPSGASCDGLNTAGYRWVRRIEGLEDNTGASQNTNRNQYNIRIDHSFNAAHKLSFTGTRENNCCISPGTARITNWPGGYSGHVIRNPDVYTAGLVSTLSPTIVNEFRTGLRRSHYYSWGSYALPGKDGDEARAFLPQNNGILLVPKPTLFPEHLVTNGVNSTRGQRSPLYMYSDTISWTRGSHAFKGGGEVRFTGSNGFNAEDIDAVRAFFGPGGVPVRGIDNIAIPGLIGANQTTAQNLLIDLAGSIQRIREGFTLVDAKNPRFVDSRELKEKWRYWRQREFSTFFKDDWKLRPNLTVNVGVRYEFYGVPWEAQGLAARPVGGTSGLFGISGTSFADWWNPGRLNGSITKVELVGKNSPQPDKKIYNNDWNNVAPAVGLSWSLPWWGKDKTILRAGYGVSYQGAVTYIGLDGAVGNLPGTNLFVEHTTANYLSLSNFSLPVPQSTAKPLEPIPLTDRQQTIQGYEDNHPNPYVQNWNLEIQRELVRNLTLEARYIGSKATKLWTPFPLNDVNIFENGILNAFNITRAGGNAPLFDQMLGGLNLGLGQVNGTTVTGSASLRQNTLFRAAIANGDIGQFASTLNTSTTLTNQGGGLVRNGRFPENFIVVNPQFQSVTLNSNVGNSTYHSMQLQVTKRLSQGFTNQMSYTWSRTLGQSGTGDTNPDRTANYRNPRNIALDKGLLSYHRTHAIRSSGTLELPFGPNRPFLSNAPRLVERLVERWQFGGIFSWTSGAPLDILASTSSITASTATMTPNLVGNFPKSMGKVTKLANGVIYFDGLQQVTDSTVANVSTLQGLQGAFSNRAIADSQGRLLLVNPAPGEVGSLGAHWIEGPSKLGLDMNLLKRVRIDETKEFELRLDAINILNTPQWDNPTTDINSFNFGRITNATGNRAFIINARVNF
ncbi:MAG: hypothetical protein DMG12_22215 [Acidobacteria bacterium]|nr:MAG: hypothetical protein DMG12_22215 [Acidobacteriota bacterium]